MNYDLIEAFDRDRIPARAAELWGVSEKNLQHLRSGQSFVYAFSEGDRRGVIKITPESHDPAAPPRNRWRGRGDRQVEAELAFISFLLEQGVPVVRPLAAQSGKLVEALETPLGGFAVSSFAHLEVRRKLWDTDDESVRVYRQIGRITGQIHRASKSYRPTGQRRPRWDEDWPVNDPAIHRYLPDTETREEYAEVLHWMQAKAELAEDFGLIHHDISVTNVGFEGTEMRMFDFDGCNYHWFCFDLAVALSRVADQPEKLRQRQFAALLDGYQQENQLPSDYQEQINWLWRWYTVMRSASHLHKRDEVLVAPWEENRRQMFTYSVDSLPPWEQNRRRQLYGLMFGQLRW